MMKRAAQQHSAFLLALFATIGSSISVQAATLETAVRCSPSSTEGLDEVWARYVQGLQTGNLALLQSIFAAQGSFHILSGQKEAGEETLSVRTFANALPGWVAKPDPKTVGKLSDVTVNWNMAVVQGWLHFGPTRFEDVMTLYCAEGRWQIVGKMTRGQSQ